MIPGQAVHVLAAALKPFQRLVQVRLRRFQMSLQTLQTGAHAVGLRHHPRTVQEGLCYLAMLPPGPQVAPVQCQPGQAQVTVPPAAFPLHFVWNLLCQGQGAPEACLRFVSLARQAVDLAQRVGQLLDPGHVGPGLRLEDVQVFLIVFSRLHVTSLPMVQPPQAAVSHRQPRPVAQLQFYLFGGAEGSFGLGPAIEADVSFGQGVLNHRLLVGLLGPLADDAQRAIQVFDGLGLTLTAVAYAQVVIALGERGVVVLFLGDGNAFLQVSLRPIPATLQAVDVAQLQVHQVQVFGDLRRLGQLDVGLKMGNGPRPFLLLRIHRAQIVVNPRLACLVAQVRVDFRAGVQVIQCGLNLPAFEVQPSQVAMDFGPALFVVCGQG